MNNNDNSEEDFLRLMAEYYEYMLAEVGQDIQRVTYIREIKKLNDIGQDLMIKLQLMLEESESFITDFFFASTEKIVSLSKQYLSIYQTNINMIYTYLYQATEFRGKAEDAFFEGFSLVPKANDLMKEVIRPIEEADPHGDESITILRETKNKLYFINICLLKACERLKRSIKLKDISKSFLDDIISLYDEAVSESSTKADVNLSNEEDF